MDTSAEEGMVEQEFEEDDDDEGVGFNGSEWVKVVARESMNAACTTS